MFTVFAKTYARRDFKPALFLAWEVASQHRYCSIPQCEVKTVRRGTIWPFRAEMSTDKNTTVKEIKRSFDSLLTTYRI